jgi:hypothetical protein
LLEKPSQIPALFRVASDAIVAFNALYAGRHELGPHFASALYPTTSTNESLIPDSRIGVRGTARDPARARGRPAAFGQRLAERPVSAGDLVANDLVAKNATYDFLKTSLFRLLRLGSFAAGSVTN